MITILVDEGHAFDFLSILEIKGERGVIDEFEVKEHTNHVLRQTGGCIFKKVTSSPEYKNLKRINGILFDVVDKAKGDAVLASVVQNYNTERFFAKKNLQTTFFPNEKFLEKKN